MSYNPSRPDRSEYRKTGRSGSFNQNRQFSGGDTSKGGGAPSNNSSRSFKKNNSANASQAWQSSGRSPNVDPAPRDLPNGAHQEQQSHRVPGTPVISTSSNVKPADDPNQKITRAVSKASPSNVSAAAPPPNVSSASSEFKSPTTPAKAPGDASKSFALQFGSISPGCVNGMQIPARTNSAPPNLDEQKKDQARRDALRATPAMPNPPIPKQPLPKKDGRIVDQPNAGEAQSASKSKRETHVIQTVTQAPKPSHHPISGMPMQLPFHQLHVHVQFGGPNPQIHSQAMSGTSLPMPMSLPIGSPPQHSMFVPSFQPHPMQSQVMMHQGQSLNFSSQMGHQLPPQLGNIGMNMGPQFPQQAAVKFSPSRKAVKITHPDTREELRLDSSSGPRSHPNVPPQSQPIPSFPPNVPMNFYTNSYNVTPLFYPGASSVPLNNTQVPATSQPPRVLNQVTVKPHVGSRWEKEPLPPTSALSVGKTESLKSSRLHGEDSIRHHKEIQPALLSSLPQSKAALGTSSASASCIDGSASPSVSATDEANIGVAMPGSRKNKHKETGNRSQQDQIDGLLTSLSSLPSQLSEAEAVDSQSTSSGINLVTDAAKVSLSTTATAACEASNFTEEVAKDENTGDTSKSIGGKDVTSIQTTPETMGTKEIEESSDQKVIFAPDGLLKQTQEMKEETSGCSSDEVKMDINIVASTQTSDGGNATVTGVIMQDDRTSTSDMSLSVHDSIGTTKPDDLKYPPADQESAPENEEFDKNSVDIVPPPANIKDNIVSDTNVAKNAVRRGKKKKDLYKKAEAAGTSSDLYNAYKGPEEKKETVPSVEGTVNMSSSSIKQTSSDMSQENVPCDKPVQIKAEPDDWEDAAEISSPQLEISKNDGDGYGLTTKKYSRDFLLKFMEQCTDMPEGFEISSDVADALMVSGVNVSRESHPSPGRNIDRQVGGPRLDRRGSGLGNEDKWNKFTGPLMPGRGDMVNIAGLRPGQGGNHGVLRNPRAQTPLQYAGGILSGPMQAIGPHGALQRNNSESDRWQRGNGFPKGLMPYPQIPLPVMHKAEKKYEVGKIADEEEAKQRQLKGILNKLTPQNFEKLFEQVKQVNIDNVVTLSGVISQIFDKALMEPTFCEMYANFCLNLAADLPDLSVDNQKITFRRLLLNKCQEEFERGEREEEQANKVEEEGEVKQTAEEREEKRLQARRRMLGNIRLIGELYKKRMLTERIMHECMNKLFGQYQNPDEENIEALCKLMSTIGEMIDHPKAKDHMDAYFDIMAQLSNNMKLSSRVRFMLKDAIDLRKNKWQQRRKVEGPKKIEEVHRDAAQERHAQASRLSRAPSMGNSVRRGPPMEFSPRSPSMLPSQVSGFCAGPIQQRGYGSSQDARVDERHFENRMSVTLPQRPLGEDSITLGPQGGLARGMAFRGPLSTPGHNGFSSISEQVAYGQREDVMPRYVPDRFAATPVHGQPHPQERSNYGNREVRNTDRDFDRSLLTSPPGRGGPPSTQNLPSEKVWTEEQLRDKSLAAIKEFYSARDENEVALCIRDLNTPSFYPSMISIWLADSFERKDMERDLLTKLLINLTKSRDDMITEDQLIKGFESVLAILEDAVNDAPKAAEFLGWIFAKVVMENVISLSVVGRLIYEGGEEEGRLVEIGLAAEVLGSVLDIIKSKKGDSILNEIRSGSNLQLESFRPPCSSKSLRIDKFI